MLSGRETEPSETLIASVERFGTPLDVLDGPVAPALLRRINSDDVVAGVLGARRAPGGARPVGHIVAEILQKAGKPVLVVPPEHAHASLRPWRRVLVPLEGTEASATAASHALANLTGAADAVVLHVFTPDTAPVVLDRAGRDLMIWDDEFLARFGPPGARLEHRSGVAAHEIVKACDRDHADMVVLSWSQSMTSGHAAVVRDVLAWSAIPVLLTPARGAG